MPNKSNRIMKRHVIFFATAGLSTLMALSSATAASSTARPKIPGSAINRLCAVKFVFCFLRWPVSILESNRLASGTVTPFCR